MSNLRDPIGQIDIPMSPTKSVKGVKIVPPPEAVRPQDRIPPFTANETVPHLL